MSDDAPDTTEETRDGLPVPRPETPQWWHDFADGVSRMLDPPATGHAATWLSQAVSGRAVLVTATPKRWLRDSRRLQDSGGSDVVIADDPGSVGLAIVSPDEVLPSGTTIDVLLADDVLLHVDDPSALLERFVGHLSWGCDVHVAVSVGVQHSPAVRRGFGPASLLGLLAGHVAVRDLAVSEGVMHASGARERDEGRRTSAALEALSQTQDDVEALLSAGSVAVRDLSSARADVAARQALADSLRERLEACVAETERLEARADRLGDEVARHEAEGAILHVRAGEAEERAAELAGEISALRDELATERRRREAIYATRWWRLGQVIRLVRRDPRRAGEALRSLPAAMQRATTVRRGDGEEDT